MKTINKTLTSAACLALLSICAPQRLHADPRPSSVTVINTPDNPVPVNVQNLVSVPSSITVINTPDNPVPVTVQDEIATRSADNPAFQPYSKSVDVGLTESQNLRLGFPVPAGKRLVIEYVAATARLSKNQDVEITLFSDSVGGSTGFNLLRVAQGRDFQKNFMFGVGQSLRLYADSRPTAPSESVVMRFFRNSSDGEMSVDATISGYLVDVSP